MDDPTIAAFRERISALDREILHAFNRRLELVAELKRLKKELGLGFVDPEREGRMLDELRDANAGPLSADGVEALLRALLDLTKREV